MKNFSKRPANINISIDNPLGFCFVFVKKFKNNLKLINGTYHI